MSIHPELLKLDPQVEGTVYSRMLQHYSEQMSNVEDYVKMLVAIDPFYERFEYLRSVVGSEIFSSEKRFFCSGFSAGSEMIVARHLGFGNVYGVEVDPFLVEVSQQRLAQFKNMFPIFYEGNYLPYGDNQYDVVASGHVIEHTRNPELYLQECLRVLNPGGYLSLEFPDRFHFVELHTGLPSLEWLPKNIRNALLRLISSKYSPLNKSIKQRYYSIYSTNLQQISITYVHKIVKRFNSPCKLLNITKPRPGFVRCIFQKC